MPIIKSISGIRGTIGDKQGEDLTSADIINFSAAYGTLIKEKHANTSIKIVIGRDARVSGKMIKNLVIDTLVSLGIDIIDLDLATTPTVEMAIIKSKAQGGIIITASHNPKEWNALKLLNEKGEFISAEEGNKLVALAENAKFNFSNENNIGTITQDSSFSDYHINEILKLDLVDRDMIEKKGFKVVVDGINSVGGIIIPQLLERLGVENIIKLNCKPDGNFAHNPEPLERNLTEIMEKVKSAKADLGIVVDPDVDRLAFIDENGKMFGEEYTLVAVADYILQNYSSDSEYKKITVSNLSSSRALKDVTEKNGGEYFSSAVGEINVVDKMKETRAIIGGEGNGGIIYPQLHYGRDALVGLALFLSALAKNKLKTSEFKRQFPEYHMIKDRLELSSKTNLKNIFNSLKEEYKNGEINDADGLKIDWPDAWIHLRASNTEPIIRLYAEAKSLELVRRKIEEIKAKILAYIKQ